MSAINPSRPDWIHELLGELSIRLENLPDVTVPDGFAEHYVRHLPDSELGDLEPGRVADLIVEHLRLGQRRSAGESQVRVLLPEQPGASTVMLIVADDRPFLVDTVSMDITRGGWNIRSLFHPQYEVHRDGDGTLTGLGGTAPGATA